MGQSYVEKRSEFRFPIVIPVEYFRSDNSSISSYSLDISKGGAFISADEPLEIGARCDMRLTVPIDNESSRVFKTEGAVAWNKVLPFKSKRNGMGIQFFEPLPENIFLNALTDTTKRLTRETKAKKELEEKLEKLERELEKTKKLAVLGGCVEKILFELTNPILALSGTLELLQDKLYDYKRSLEEHSDIHKKEHVKIVDELDECCATIDRIMKEYKVISDLAHIAGYRGDKLEKVLRERLAC
jgi:Tfp pilus assembly protein PilZ